MPRPRGLRAWRPAARREAAARAVSGRTRSRRRRRSALVEHAEPGQDGRDRRDRTVAEFSRPQIAARLEAGRSRTWSARSGTRRWAFLRGCTRGPGAHTEPPFRVAGGRCLPDTSRPYLAVRHTWLAWKTPSDTRVALRISGNWAGQWRLSGHGCVLQARYSRLTSEPRHDPVHSVVSRRRKSSRCSTTSRS
jgi:hypothetical protein